MYPSIILEMPPNISQRYGHKELTPSIRSHSESQICTSHPPIIPTKHARHHNSPRGSRCDSNHAPTVSPKLYHTHGDFSTPRPITQAPPRHTPSLTSDHPWHLKPIRPYFPLNLYNPANPHQNKAWDTHCLSKTRTPSRRFRHPPRPMTQDPPKHTSSLTSDHPRHLKLIRPYFPLNLYNSANPCQNKPLSGL